VAMAATALAGMTFGFLKFRNKTLPGSGGSLQVAGGDTSSSVETGIADEGTISNRQ
jgi:hypothetical protein